MNIKNKKELHEAAELKRWVEECEKLGRELEESKEEK